MSHKIALLAVLAVGTAFISGPAFAQQEPPPGSPIYQGPMSEPPTDPNIARILASPSVGSGFVPGQYYNYAPGVAPGAAGWCQSHFRSYNPATGRYLGYDGNLHSCP
jgi:hypothetical protein